MRALIAILRVVVGPALADSIAGDLEEGRRARAARSPISARFWLVGTALAIIGHAALARAREEVMSRLDIGRIGDIGGIGRNGGIGGTAGKLRADVRHAWRSLSVQRGASLAIVAVLALGVGLSSAMFAMTDPFVFRALPYSDPDELVVIRVGTTGLTPDAEIPTIAEWRERTSLFREIGGYRFGPMLRLRLPDRAAAIRSREVTRGLFRVLGLPEPPFEGRSDGGPLPVVLTTAGVEALGFADIRVGQALTRQHEGASDRGASDRGVSDRGVSDSQSSHELLVLATAPSAFVFPARARAGVVHALTPIDADTPIIEVNQWSDDGRPSYSETLTVIARPQPGIGPEAIVAALARPLPSGEALSVRVEPLVDDMTSSVRPLAMGALAAALLVLLVCAANIANLMIARGAYRAGELSTRVALGASRLDLARLVLVEIALLTVCAVTLGLMLASIVLATVRGVIPEEYVFLGAPAITRRVVAAAAASGLLVMVMGALPVALAWRAVHRPTVRRRIATDSRSVRTLRFAFAAGQSALAMILVLGASLLVQSYAKLLVQDTGFDADALVVTVSYPPELSAPELQAEIARSIDGLRRIPGVADTAAAVGPLVDTWATGMLVRISGQRALVSGTAVTPGFFDAAGMSMVSGRRLMPADAGTGAVINEALARAHFAEGSPIGRLIEPSGSQPLEVVGVVADAHDHALDRQAEPVIFELLEEPRYTQMPVNYVLRPGGDTPPSRDALRRTLTEINRDAVIERVDTFGERLSNSVRDRTFATMILSLFGIAGTAVTLAGLVGIVVFIVARRTREIAIRVAIGAQPGDVRRLVAGEAIAAAGTGVLIGLLAGRWLSAWLESLVYGVELGDWTAALIVAAATLALTTVAALVPARRALSLEPTQALRAE